MSNANSVPGPAVYPRLGRGAVWSTAVTSEIENDQEVGGPITPHPDATRARLIGERAARPAEPQVPGPSQREAEPPEPVEEPNETDAGLVPMSARSASPDGPATSDDRAGGTKSAPRYTVVRAVQTCRAFPSQWDAWTNTGQYLYLRFRHGTGTVEQQPGPDFRSWAYENTVIEFDHDDLDGTISLGEFAEHANLELALTEAPLSVPITARPYGAPTPSPRMAEPTCAHAAIGMESRHASANAPSRDHPSRPDK